MRAKYISIQIIKHLRITHRETFLENILCTAPHLNTTPLMDKIIKTRTLSQFLIWIYATNCVKLH